MFQNDPYPSVFQNDPYPVFQNDPGPRIGDDPGLFENLNFLNRLPVISMIIWLVVWNIFYFPIYWEMSSSQLTFICFRGVGLNHQPVING